MVWEKTKICNLTESKLVKYLSHKSSKKLYKKFYNWPAKEYIFSYDRKLTQKMLLIFQLKLLIAKPTPVSIINFGNSPLNFWTPPCTFMTKESKACM